MIELTRRSKLYFVAVMVFTILLMITAVQTHTGVMSIYDACWQIVVSVLGSLWFWNLLRIEMTRSARRRK